MKHKLNMTDEHPRGIQLLALTVLGATALWSGFWALQVMNHASNAPRLDAQHDTHHAIDVSTLSISILNCVSWCTEDAKRLVRRAKYLHASSLFRVHILLIDGVVVANHLLSFFQITVEP